MVKPTVSGVSDSISGLTHSCAVAPSPADSSGVEEAHVQPSASDAKPLNTKPLRMLTLIRAFVAGPYTERTNASTTTEPGGEILLCSSRGARRMVTSGSGTLRTSIDIVWLASIGVASSAVVEFAERTQLCGFSATGAVLPTRASIMSGSV